MNDNIDEEVLADLKFAAFVLVALALLGLWWSYLISVAILLYFILEDLFSHWTDTIAHLVFRAWIVYGIPFWLLAAVFVEIPVVHEISIWLMCVGPANSSC